MSLKYNLLKLRKIFTYNPFETILLFFLKGSNYQGFSSKFIPPPDLYNYNSIKDVERDGIKYQLDRSCLMQWFIYWDLQDITREKLYSLVKTGDVIFDVGTNVGETLLHFAKITGESGFVYGFEPDEKNYANVLKNISLNDFENVHVFDLGVSDKAETLKLFRVDSHNLGMNRILNEAEAAEFEDFTTIETNTLDHIVEENKIEKVDVIKIDIEGYEMHALRGAKELLKKFQPRLFIEVGYTRLLKHGTSPNEMIDFLQNLNYSVYHAETDEKIDSDFDFSPLGDGIIDVLAIIEK